MLAKNFRLEAAKVFDVRVTPAFAGIVEGWNLRVAAGATELNAAKLAGAILLANSAVETGNMMTRAEDAL